MSEKSKTRIMSEVGQLAIRRNVSKIKCEITCPKGCQGHKKSCPLYGLWPALWIMAERNMFILYDYEFV